MLRKLQSRLTYANVMSTIAVFGMLAGGVAWALDRNEVKSRHIAPGAVNRSDTNDKLRLKCPGGTRYHEGACIERDARSSASKANALADCVDEGRRLPTLAELLSFRLEPGITLPSEGEWTDELDGGSARGITVDESGFLESTSSSDALTYRCVARPKR
jgi:hypothetical protein